MAHQGGLVPEVVRLLQGQQALPRSHRGRRGQRHETAVSATWQTTNPSHVSMLEPGCKWSIAPHEVVPWLCYLQCACTTACTLPATPSHYRRRRATNTAAALSACPCLSPTPAHPQTHGKGRGQLAVRRSRAKYSTTHAHTYLPFRIEQRRRNRSDKTAETSSVK